MPPRRLGIDLGASVCVGDRWRDVEAGRRAGCTTVFVDREYSEPVPDRPDVTVRELRDGVSWILDRSPRMTDARLPPGQDLRRRRRPLATSTRCRADPWIQGFTTNPTLMRKAGHRPTTRRSRGDLLELVPDRPISFEVFSDDLDEMERQALQIASWGENVYVKIPITDTDGTSIAALGPPPRRTTA